MGRTATTARILLLLAVPALLMAQKTVTMTANSQGSAVQILEVPDNQIEAQDSFDLQNPRKAFLFVVPPGGKITVALDHPRKALLQLTKATMAEWTGRRAGPWQKMIPLDGRLEHVNREKAAQEVLFLVTDPSEVSNRAEPYKLKISRSWIGN
jgi:hypothetical protein